MAGLEASGRVIVAGGRAGPGRVPPLRSLLDGFAALGSCGAARLPRARLPEFHSHREISSFAPVTDVTLVTLARFGRRLSRLSRVSQGRLAFFQFLASRYVRVTCPPPSGLEGVLARVPSVSIVASRARASSAVVTIRPR